MFYLLLLSVATAHAFSDAFLSPFPAIPPLHAAPAAALGGALPTAFSVSKCFGNSMVLQRGVPAILFGLAPPGTSIVTTFAGQKFTATAGAADGVWRQALPPQAANRVGQTILFSVPATGESAALSGVLFGDVYLCGGQSNQVFAVGGVVNASAEIQRANSYPLIRLFTVGQKNASGVPLLDLASIEQPWSTASNASISSGGEFGFFSATCWFFARDIFDALGDAAPPMGLISSNWGGTPIEDWMTQKSIAPCNGKASAILYNAMIYPWTVGPMALTGFIWYQCVGAPPSVCLQAPPFSP